MMFFVVYSVATPAGRVRGGGTERVEAPDARAAVETVVAQMGDETARLGIPRGTVMIGAVSRLDAEGDPVEKFDVAALVEGVEGAAAGG